MILSLAGLGRIHCDDNLACRGEAGTTQKEGFRGSFGRGCRYEVPARDVDQCDPLRHTYGGRLMDRLISVLWIVVAGGVGSVLADAPPVTVLFPSNPPPLACWGPSDIVDEPEGAFHSLGLTLWHLGRDPDAIAAYHGWLRARGLDPFSVFTHPPPAPPADVCRILVDPERGPPSGWRVQGDWIIGPRGDRGPEHRFPLQVPRSGLYRIWIRHIGYTNATAVTHLTLWRRGEENERPVVYEEFNTRLAPEPGPRWHPFTAELTQGDYTAVLGHVVRYYHVPAKTPFADHQVDCLYLTDAIWEGEPSDELLQTMRGGGGSELQKVRMQPLDAAGRATWALWQVRPLDWSEARRDERAFRLGYAFWRSRVDALAHEDYQAGPKDPVCQGAPDYREPRRQVIFDPVWNMVGNPHYILCQAEALSSDIDPAARDIVADYLHPGMFPVVVGQWQRSGGGLTADHAAQHGLAMGSYLAPHAGDWHVWVQFKNINYFEFFGVHLDTVRGRDATWMRTERLYPGGHSVWAKVGVATIPPITESERAAHAALAAKGVFVRNGKPDFVYQQGAWTVGPDALINASNGVLLARSALRAEGNFHVTSRLRMEQVSTNAGAFFFRDTHGLRENTLTLPGWILKGPSLAQATNSADVAFKPGVPFTLELTRAGTDLRVRVDGVEVASANLIEGPAGGFGFRAGQTDLQVMDFKAQGELADGLDMARSITVSVWMDRYKNPRTYRGVYKLLVTDDPDYTPVGNLQPRLSLARYLANLRAAGATPERGYAMNVVKGLGGFVQIWMPDPEPERSELAFSLARDAEACGRLVFRSARTEPIVLNIEPGPLIGPAGSYSGKVRWRVVGFAPSGAGREAWTPFLLLRRPFLGLPPLGTAGAWLTVDSIGVPPGDYTCAVRIRARTWDGDVAFPERTVNVKVSVKNVAIAPERPILLHGWTLPPPGEIYRRDWFRRFNVWQGPFFSKADMERYGVKLQIYSLQHPNTNEIAHQIARARALGLGYDDWMFSIMDEPTGLTEEELKPYLTIAKMVRDTDPNVKITMNPGEAARAATFKILQPYVDLWNPYEMHLTFEPSGKDYLKKPWIWYTTPCYQDKSSTISVRLYEQVRSVVGKPGDCRGTALFAPYYPWRDPWDTAYEHISDVSVMVLPSRHGPVATPAWEALLLGVQHANLARMVRERAGDNDPEARALWEKGSPEDLLDWLEKHPGTPGRK